MKKLTNVGQWLVAYWSKFEHTGLFIAIIFTTYSLTPSLLPRSPIYQGLLSGVVFAIGYGIGVFILYLWHYFELPTIKKSRHKKARIIFLIIAILAVTYAVSNWVKWQNSILSVMDQELISANFVSLSVVFISIVVAMLLIAIGRLILKWFRFVMKKMHKFIPRNVSKFIGFFLALIIFIGLINGILIESVYNTVDSISAQVNQLTDDGIEKPSNPDKTGGQNSLVEWESLGRMGRSFISSGPSKEDISNFTGRESKEPIRVYVGMESKDTPEERAALALEELKRQQAFDRKILILTTPTGTGWMDPYAMDTVEYLHDGDTANAGIQYSYLSSQATLVFHPMRAIKSSTVMFNTIYDHWKTLPSESRPKIYLFGVSLGSYGGEESVKLYQILENPINGALWAGPPFVNDLHKDFVAHRNPDSPSWLPEFENGALMRAISNKRTTHDNYAPWGPIRIIYLQYASDPMTAFSPSLFWHTPEWLKDERAHDVSPLLSWTPMVTFFQIAFDLIVSVSGAPLGYGHNFSPADYIDGWIELTEPQDWNNSKTDELKNLFLKK